MSHLSAILATGLIPPSGRYTVSTTSNAGVRGAANAYPYYAAKLYRLHIAKSGAILWQATRVAGPARRGSGVLAQDCDDLAAEYGCSVSCYSGAASLHNQPAH